MKYTDGLLSLTMLSAFSRPFLKLGVKAVDIMEAYYSVLQTPRPPTMSELLTAGGNSYADLKLTAVTFGGQGRVDVTPTALVVDIRDASRTVGGAQQAKEHFALCESTLASAMEGVEFSERVLRAQVFLTCEGGAKAVEQFIAEKGEGAFKLTPSPVTEWTKQYSLEFRAVDPSTSSRLQLKVEPAVALRDLFVEFTHTAIGSPIVALSVARALRRGRKVDVGAYEPHRPVFRYARWSFSLSSPCLTKGGRTATRGGPYSRCRTRCLKLPQVSRRVSR